jgi:hypothetical protein
MALEDAKNPMQGVSGPGKYAKRTDLQYQSNSYGDGVAYDAAKSGAPLATAPKNPMLSQAPQVAAPQTPVTGMFEPTARPNEPVTHGVDIGAGAGSEALSMRQPDDTNFMASIQSAKPVLAYIADLPNTSPETRAAIAQLWNMQ